MIKLNIKPLSVNQAFQGRRFKTPKYKKYTQDLLMILPALKVSKNDLCLELEFGFSNKLSDFDNPVKPFVDCLQKKYGFNDRQIKQCVINVCHVKKGKDYIKFKLKEIGH